MGETVFNQSLWGDEGFSAILSMKSVPEILSIISRDTSPPLWNLCEYLVFQTFGTSETNIRSLSLLFFLGTIFFTYKIGSHFFGKKTGLLAALMTFLNPFFFTYAFEGRMYSIMSFGVAGSMYFFLKRKWFLYILFTLWALYSHHFAIFILIIQGIWFLYEIIIKEKVLAKKMLRSFFFVGIGYLPWIIPLYKQTMMVKGGFWLGKPTADDFFRLISDYLAQGIKNDLIIPIVDVKLYEFGLILVIITLIVRNWFKNIKNTLFLLSWFLLPIIITFLISQKFQSIFYNRYILYTIPASMLILVSGKRGTASYILIGIVAVIFGITDFNYFSNPVKLPFRQYSQYVKSVSDKRDILINWNSSSHHLWETKYYNIPAPIFIPEGKGDLPYFVGTALMDKNDIIRSIPENIENIGVVTSGNVEDVKIAGYTKNEDVVEFDKIKYIVLSKE